MISEKKKEKSIYTYCVRDWGERARRQCVVFRSSGLVETKNGYKGVVLVAEKKREKMGVHPV